MNEEIEEIYKVTDEGIYGFFKEHRYLSNFHQCQVWYEGICYPSSENAYQAAKLPSAYRGNLTQCTPAESKKEWKNYPKLFTPTTWETVKYNIMLRIVNEKFLSHPYLLLKLKETRGLYLEETNYWGDVYWGVHKGVGFNNLGRVLMHVRDSQFLGDEEKPLELF